MAPSVPPPLKKIKVFLARAEELDRDRGNPESRVVAYNLRQYAVLAGIPLAGSDPAAKACLGDLLGALEQEKAAMAVFSRAEHWKISRKVADRVFEKADGEDRAGAANKGTAKTFYAAGTFYEILQQFYEEKEEGGEGEGGDEESKARKEEEEQRRIYCKWKATDILNAVKEGRTPTPGGYDQEGAAREEEAPPSAPGGAMKDVPTDAHGLPVVDEEAPPAPSMPSSDLLSPGDDNNETNRQLEATNSSPDAVTPPPAYDGIELSLNGDPTPTVEDVDKDAVGDNVYVPGADEVIGNGLFVDAPAPVAPPPYPDPAPARPSDASPLPVPPPAGSRTLPLPVAAPAPANKSVFSSLFGGSSSAKKLSKAQMADAVELTKFALSALQQGDGDLGRERLEQALGLWRR